jgi:hypothetical protein
VVSTQKLTLQRSPAELAAHCQGAWKNENYLYEKFREQASDGGPVLTSHPNNKLSVCIYQIRASDPEVGDFLRGLVLDAAASENLRAALGGAGPRGTCPLQRQFAVISTPPGAEVNVELGGCWRVQRNDGGRQTTGSAEPTVVRSILGIS